MIHLPLNMSEDELNSRWARQFLLHLILLRANVKYTYNGESRLFFIKTPQS